MTSKALRKQLLAAVAMVIVAAIAVSSSTFAWFAAGTSVTASGMTVAAQSDAVFLQIKALSGAADEGTITGAADFGTSTAFTMTGVKVYPAAHNALANAAAIEADDSTNMSNWYYKYNGNAAASTDDMTAAYDIAVGDFDKYVVKLTYQVKLHESNASAAATNLKVSSITFTDGAKGLRAIVVGNDGMQEFTTTVADNSAGTVLQSAVTTTAQPVYVYLFIDGNDAAVYTNNIAALTDSISINFSVT